MAEIALHVIESGRSLAYGGDLRQHGFTELLTELTGRYRNHPRHDGTIVVTDYLAWPVHIRMTSDELAEFSAEHEPAADLVFLALDGARLAPEQRMKMHMHEPDDAEWTEGLTAMRIVMRGDIRARIVLGGRVEGYRGAMPGIAEEACLSLEAGQPVFLARRVRRVRARHCGDGRSHRALGRLARWMDRAGPLPQVLTGRSPQRAIPRREHRPGMHASYPGGSRPRLKGPASNSRGIGLAIHKVFVSYHHRSDQGNKEALVEFGEKHGIFVDRSVDTGDIPDDWPDERIRRAIRDQYLRDSTVTIVLVGRETRRRKHVDWEIHSSMYDGLGEQEIGDCGHQPPRNLRR